MSGDALHSIISGYYTQYISVSGSRYRSNLDDVRIMRVLEAGNIKHKYCLACFTCTYICLSPVLWSRTQANRQCPLGVNPLNDTSIGLVLTSRGCISSIRAFGEQASTVPSGSEQPSCQEVPERIGRMLEATISSGSIVRVDSRTSIDTSKVLEWTQEQHENDAHAEYLNAPARHVQHERLHWQ